MTTEELKRAIHQLVDSVQSDVTLVGLHAVVVRVVDSLKALNQKGESVFGSAHAFRRWMDKPAYGLGGQVPFVLLHTSGGIDLIMDEVTRIEYGDLA